MSSYKALSSESEYDQTVSNMMFSLYNIISKKHRLALRDLAITTLQGIELSFIVEAEKDGGTSQRVVCELLSVTPPAVLKMTLELEEKGLIYRVDNPHDKRSQLLFPTEEGKQVSRTFRKIMMDVDERIFSCCSEEDRQTLLAIMTKVVQSNR